MLDSDCSTPQTKTCKKCGVAQAADQFPGGYYTCRECKRAYSRAYHAENRERLNAASRAYRAANLDAIKEQSRQFREANRERLAATSRANYAASAEARRAQKKAYRAENAEKCRASVRAYHKTHRQEMTRHRKEWAARNPGKQREYQKRWNERNPEAFREGQRRDAAARRARHANAPVIERISRAALWERDGGRCHICGKKCDPNNWHADHLVPLSKGGEHTMRNLAVSHPVCNLRRHNSGPAQLRFIG